MLDWIDGIGIQSPVSFKSVNKVVSVCPRQLNTGINCSARQPSSPYLQSRKIGTAAAAVALCLLNTNMLDRAAFCVAQPATNTQSAMSGSGSGRKVSAGSQSALNRRPIHFWRGFNEWCVCVCSYTQAMHFFWTLHNLLLCPGVRWRLELEKTSRRPQAETINRWIETLH